MKYECKKYVNESGIDPMTTVIMSNSANWNERNSNGAHKERKQNHSSNTINEGVKCIINHSNCDLIDDDCGDKVLEVNQKKRHCSVDKIGQSGDGNTASGSCNSYTNQMNIYQHNTINEKAFNSQPGLMNHLSGMTGQFNDNYSNSNNNHNANHCYQQPKQLSSFNTNSHQSIQTPYCNSNTNNAFYNNFQYQYKYNNQSQQIGIPTVSNSNYNSYLQNNNSNTYYNPPLTSNTQATNFFNFNLSNQNNTFQGQDPFQQFIK